jgi:hypothetical protein
MTKEVAEIFAAWSDDYRARCIKGRWCVWSNEADHHVEFDQDAIDAAEKISAFLERCARIVER